MPPSFMPPDSYTNNRHDGWDYDAEGNLFASLDATYTYDAAGEIRTVGTWEPQSSTIRSLDGTGQQLKTEELTYNDTTGTWTTTITYYLRSTMLGGQVLTELAADGAKTRTFVYAGGRVLASQKFMGTFPAVEWEHRDPSDATFRTTMVNGGVASLAELDPTSADAGINPAILSVPNEEAGTSLLPYGSFGASNHLGTTYTVDKLRVSLDYFMMALDIRFQGEFGLAEYVSRASTPKLRNYEVDFGNGERVDYGLDADLAYGYAYETEGEGTLIRNFIVNDNWSFPFAALPQNTAPDVNDLRNRITKITSNPDCAKFIKDLINKTATDKNPAEFTDALKGFEKIAGQRGYIYGDTIRRTYGFDGSTVNGTISGRNGAQVELAPPYLNVRTPAIIASQLRIQAMSALHEILHLAGENVYDDFAFAKTVADMPGAKLLPDYSKMKTYADRVSAASGYWNKALHAACKPKDW